ncbi:hypothetical protein ALC56_04306 [Trachymyrmex septentrionalis]|uniref:Uncharacterized protein n=1 Tax=Trachymyrmex septentrionalis TaxID=34720 RepID=A0A195FKG1_9HYME|nr:hypothetical protein ALC56_04306 [Trachymyrmex septentrionalis]
MVTVTGNRNWLAHGDSQCPMNALHFHTSPGGQRERLTRLFNPQSIFDFSVIFILPSKGNRNNSARGKGPWTTTWSRRGGLTAVVRSTGKIASERKREPDGSSPLRPANSTLPYPAVPTTENSLAGSFSCPMIQPYVVIGTLCGKRTLLRSLQVRAYLPLASSTSRAARPGVVHRPAVVAGEIEIEIASSEDSTTARGGLSHRYEPLGRARREETEIEKGRGRWRLQGYTRPEQGLACYSTLCSYAIRATLRLRKAWRNERPGRTR